MLETAGEPSKTEEPPVHLNTKQNTEHNAHNPDEQYLRSIKLDVSAFDERLDP